MPHAKILGFLETFWVDLEAELPCLTGICSGFSHAGSDPTLVIWWEYGRKKGWESPKFEKLFLSLPLCCPQTSFYAFYFTSRGTWLLSPTLKLFSVLLEHPLLFEALQFSPPSPSNTQAFKIRNQP